jgi:hypothetical protein
MSTSANTTTDELKPDYESHYQELLAKLREQAAQKPQGDIWDVILGNADAGPTVDQQCALMADISILWVLLVYLDLGSIGISPDSARLIVLTRLVVDDAPISPAFKQELMASVVNVVEAQAAA